MIKLYLKCLILVAIAASQVAVAQDLPETEELASTPSATSTTSTTTTTTTTTPKPSPKSSKSKSKITVDNTAIKGTDCPLECSCVERRVTCDEKKLTAIPNLSKMTNITVVSLRNNLISQVDFNLLPNGNLESLDLYNNTIKSIYLPTKKNESALSKLKTLNLGTNQLANLTANWTAWKLTSLENLDLSYNPMEELGPQAFNNTKNLQTLRIDQTKLKSIQESAFSPLTQLNNLTMVGVKLSINQLGDKQFMNNQQLEYLDLTDNGLIEVPIALRRTASIKTLILNENLMTSLRQSDFVNRSNLVTLEIKRCPKLTKIDEFAFSDLDNLKKLVITDNPKLRIVSKEAFKSDKLHKLDVLDLTGNNITTMSNPLEFPSVSFEKILLGNNPWDCNCDVSWLRLLSQKSLPIHCKTPEQFKDIESSQYFLSTDCETDSSYHTVVVTGFLIFLFVLLAAVFIQKSDICRRLLWKDQYGTIYYTKASFPPETA